MSEYDVVVIGGGSAGCAAAGVLCRHSNLRVCLIEAGPDYGALARGRWPAELLDPRRRPETHDWGYLEQRADAAPVPERRARVLGGCSAHNQCAAIWGPREDFDRWAAAGNAGWGANEITPLIEEISRAVPTVPTEELQLASWQRCFLHAAIEAGFPRLGDLSAPDPPDGVAPFHANVAGSVRWNAAFAFLEDVRGQPNLTILGHTLADRLTLTGETATTLLCQSDRGSLELGARWFVLAAGTYGSPMILLRSGIGPADHLRAQLIPVLIDHAGVGQNLHDHAGVRVCYEPSPAGREAVDDDARSGRLAQSQVILRAREEDGEATHELHVLPYLALDGSGQWVHEIMAMNMAPRSRGYVRLRGAEPLLPPVIDFRLYTDAEGYDFACAAVGLRFIRLLEQTTALRRHVTRRIDCAPEPDDVPGVERYLRRSIVRYGHAVGTCKMGPTEDRLAVVDASGRVHGTANVFVGDASVMPQAPRANTNLTCFLIGSRMAYLVKQLAG